MAAEQETPRAARERAAAGAAGLRDLDRLAWLLDSSIRLPGGYRIGLDGLIGLIPAFGDIVGAVLAMYIVMRATGYDVPRAVLARMLLNVGIEAIVGTVPVFGDLFDFAFKANRRNVALLRRYSDAPLREKRSSWLLLVGVAAGMIVFLILIVAAVVALAQLILSAL